MNLKYLHIVGISHHTAQTDQRASFAWTQNTIRIMSHALQQQSWMKEHIILSTCNRTEIICLCEQNQLLQWCAAQNMPPELTYQKHADAAIAHILRTMSGLDSKIMGETEILGQYKQAIHSGYHQKTCRNKLFHLLTRCVHAARNIRNEMDIQVHSLAHCVFNQINHHWPDIKNCRILLIGTGHVIQQHLHYRDKLKQKPACTILSRNPQTQQILGQSFDVAIKHIDRLSDMLETHNCVISATSSSNYIITQSERLSCALKKNVYFDLAMPPDIEPANDSCNLYTLDDLGYQQNQEVSIVKTEKLITAHTNNAIQELRLRAHTDLIDAFRKNWLHNAETLSKQLSNHPEKKVELLRNLEIKMRNIHQQLFIKTAPNTPKENQCSFQYAKNLLHTPTMHIKQLVATGDPTTIKTLKLLIQNTSSTRELIST